MLNSRIYVDYFSVKRLFRNRLSAQSQSGTDTTWHMYLKFSGAESCVLLFALLLPELCWSGFKQQPLIWSSNPIFPPYTYFWEVEVTGKQHIPFTVSGSHFCLELPYLPTIIRSKVRFFIKFSERLTVQVLASQKLTAKKGKKKTNHIFKSSIFSTKINFQK